MDAGARAAPGRGQGAGVAGGDCSTRGCGGNFPITHRVCRRERAGHEVKVLDWGWTLKGGVDQVSLQLGRAVQLLWTMWCELKGRVSPSPTSDPLSQRPAPGASPGPPRPLRDSALPWRRAHSQPTACEQNDSPGGN